MSDKDDKDFRRTRLEGVSELLKRAVELGVEKATEAPDNLKEFASSMKLPKEIAGVILTQIEETKNGLFRVVAKEMRDFLEQTNVSGEMQKLLTTVQFEINTTIRFKPNDAPATPSSEESETHGSHGKGEGAPTGESQKFQRPEVTTDVTIKREERGVRERRRPRE